MKTVTMETKRAVKWTCVLVWGVVFALTCPIFRFAQTGHVTRRAGVSDGVNLQLSSVHANGSRGGGGEGNWGGEVEEYQNCWDDAIDAEFSDYVPYGIILHLLGFFLPFSIIAWCYSHVVLTIFRTLHSRPLSTRGGREGDTEGAESGGEAGRMMGGRGRKGGDRPDRGLAREAGLSVYLGARSPYAHRRRKSIRTIVTITLLFALCFFPFHVTRTVFLVLKVTRGVPCHTMTMVSMCYKITRPLASFNAWLNALLYFLTKEKTGGHCCQATDNNNAQPRGGAGLLRPLRMMGKAGDVEEGGIEGEIDDKEDKDVTNTPGCIHRGLPTLRYTAE